MEDFIEVAAKSDIDLNEWVLDWLEGTTLPGFIVADVRVTKLTKEEISPYQTTFVIHNAELVAGLVEVSSLRDGVRVPDSIFLHGHQSVAVAIQTDKPLREILIEPRFAQNRERFPIRLPEYDGESVSDNPTKPLVSEVEWLPQVSTAIVVDDLNPGFSIVGQQQKRKEGFNFPGIEIGPNSEEALDQGLPVRATSVVGVWERKSDPFSYSFGRYRRTLALIARGNQNTYARFAAELPRSGTWQLEYFVPGRVTHVQPYDFVRNSRSLFFGSVLDNPRANPTIPMNTMPFK